LEELSHFISFNIRILEASTDMENADLQDVCSQGERLGMQGRGGLKKNDGFP
jgi:hypothetical protein